VLKQYLRTRQKGDTLIEVLFAFTILSMVIVGAMSIMNQGTIAAQRALETTLVRGQIDAQATTLRFLHDAYVAKFQPNLTYDANTPAGQWAVMAAAISATSATSFGSLTTCPTPPSGSFVLDASNATYKAINTTIGVPATTYAQVTYDPVSGVLKDAQGIWIEAIRSVASGDVNQDNTRYIDFHIMACWGNPGQGPPMTIGTIVRLYEPRG
jgi:type II secretory pathway pseudopilin PulG